MARKKKEDQLNEGLMSLQTASTVIAAQPATAADAALQIGAWASSILLAKALLDQVADDKWLKWLKNNPSVQNQYYLSTVGSYNPFLFGVGGLILSWIGTNIAADLSKTTVTTEEQKAFSRARWEMAFMFGTLGFATVRFAGGDLAKVVGGLIPAIGLV